MATQKTSGSTGWMHTGIEAMDAMLAAIEAAQKTVRLEMYIVYPSPIAEQFRQALVGACQRGARVEVLVDALGSISLPESFWDALKRSGGHFRWFNPLKLKRLSFRDHRKILVCDERVGFIGGFNISTEYYGDGVTKGWRDLGMKIEGPLAVQLARAFDEMFALADFKRGPLERLRRSREQKIISTPEGTLLLGAPGRQRSPLRSALHQDLKRARHVKITSAYFLPTWRIRRELFQIVRRGGRVQLILPAKSDVALSQLASRSLYRRFLRAGIEIYEYQPQILHAKLIIIDDIVYAGSANLDVRSLQMNYELLVRMSNHRVAEEARQIFEGDLQHSQEILPAEWRRSRNFWNRMKGRWAYFILARLDPFLARQQLKRLR